MAAAQESGTPAPAAPPPAEAPAPAKDVSFSEFARARGGVDDSDAPALKPSGPVTEGAPERDDKGRFLPRDEKAKKDEPGASEAPSTAKKPDPKRAAPAPSPEVPAAEPDIAAPAGSPRALLAKGDIDGAFMAAFGKKPSEFQIDSKRWYQYREQRTRDRKDAERRSGELHEIAQKLATKYGHYVEAADLLEKGDVEGWAKKATGGKYSYNELQRRAFKQYHDEPPALKQLREENERLREQFEKDKEERRTEREREAQARRDSEVYEEFASGIAQHNDPRVAKFSRDPSFVAEVTRRIGVAWKDEGLDLEIDGVATDVFNEKYGDIFGPASATGAQTNPEMPTGTAPIPSGGPGPQTPARPGTRVPTTLKQTQAAEVTAPIPEKDSPERDAQLKHKYLAQFRRSSLG